MTKITALELLNKIKHIPCIDLNQHEKDSEGRVKSSVCSKGERQRLLLNKAVVINGKRPGPKDEVTLPIYELIFFPNGQRKCTMIYESKVDQTESILSDVLNSE